MAARASASRDQAAGWHGRPSPWPANRHGSTLVGRNVRVRGRRTSLRLEETVWDAMAEICWREQVSLDQLCDWVDRRRMESSLASGLRIFVLGYFRAAATEHGHAAAGHGVLHPRGPEG